jgi:hypothetical protein
LIVEKVNTRIFLFPLAPVVFLLKNKNPHVPSALPEGTWGLKLSDQFLSGQRFG